MRKIGASGVAVLAPYIFAGREPPQPLNLVQTDGLLKGIKMRADGVINMASALCFLYLRIGKYTKCTIKALLLL